MTDNRPPAFTVGQRVIVKGDVGTRAMELDGCYGHIVSTYRGIGKDPGMSKVCIEGRAGAPLGLLLREWLHLHRWLDRSGVDLFSNNELEATD